ncbi:phosphatidylglycerophosphatase A [Candidatus Scalindua japonica]|nr:phosphatidylglycerophosphatase A [Candidatus Scalindua japonica]
MLRHKICWIIATWFGPGLLPKAPGTWGSLSAIPFAYLISIYTCPYALLSSTVALFFIGMWVSDKIEESAQIKDPDFIVVDEVAGQWIALLPLPLLYNIYGPDLFFSISIPITVVAFITFRVFDIWKPWPVNFADKNFRGGFGIMFDDVIAGMYSLIVTSVLTVGVVMSF